MSAAGVTTEEAADRFATFLALVEASLDEPDLRGADLARRAYLSRFHFDRLVAAVAGETPAALRRRLLLERAAHRLVGSEDTVLDIAVAAGYGSNEAFTRAFTRAYGVPPSRLRASPPASLAIPTPNGVHFHPPGSIRLPSREGTSSMDLLTTMIKHHVWLVGEVVDRLQGLGDEVLDARIEISVDGIDDDPTLRSLVHRLVCQEEMWVAAVRGEQPDEDAPQDVATLRARHAVAGQAFLALAERVVRGGQLGDTFVDAVCDPPVTFTYGGMLAHVLTFAAHRRTLVMGALADAGVTDLGAGDPAHWVADHASP